VRNPGDYFVTSVGGQSLIIICAEDGTLNGFHNVCMHRATRLLSGEGCSGRISCPYHGWTYDLGGRLIGAPNSRDVPGFSLSDYRLSQIQVEDVHGLIFVNLDGEAAPVREIYPDLEDEIKLYCPDLPNLVFAHRTEATLATNWKVAVENFSECYHCALVHKSFFSEDAADGVNAKTYRIDVRGPLHVHYADAHRKGGEQRREDEFAAWWLWPNFAVQSHPGCVLNVRKWTPIDVNHTQVAVDWYFAEGAFGEDERAMVEHHAATVFAEDIPLVEWVQQGLASSAYKSGPLMIDTERTGLSEHAIAGIQDLWRDAMGENWQRQSKQP
jgi:phenylpropionate dioxygenase-like ring-hydroxylating dioxygenase large terminal subunit